MQKKMVAATRAAQTSICAALAELDGEGHFGADSWQRPGGGGGTTRVMQGGRIFEKAGVSVSEVHGTLSPEAAAQMGGGQSPGGPLGGPFFATGVSLVLHPRSPMVPTVHANYRYFERPDPGGNPARGSWWFGGGADLTPSYLFEDDAVHFHTVLKAACDGHDLAFYPRFKLWCDRYFLIPHRQEMRGLGGIFFDNLCDRPAAAVFAFVQACMQAFLPAYLPIVRRRCDHPYSSAQRAWQALRRGRYAEFNLVYDRGTLFGLRTGGRIESVLMSLPPEAAWAYDHQPAEGSPEAALTAVLRTPVDWVARR